MASNQVNEQTQLTVGIISAAVLAAAIIYIRNPITTTVPFVDTAVGIILMIALVPASLGTFSLVAMLLKKLFGQSVTRNPLLPIILALVALVFLISDTPLENIAPSAWRTVGVIGIIGAFLWLFFSILVSSND